MVRNQGAGGGGGAAGDGDWTYKMCKKVAQLTKVIYALNCKSEDNEERTQWLQRTHAAEMARLVEEYEARLTTLTEKVRTAEAERARSFGIVESAHKRLLQEAQDGFAGKLAALALEVEQCKRSYGDSLEAEKERSAAALAVEIRQIQQLKNDEAASLVKEYNDRYKAMLAEQLDAKDALEARLNAEWGAMVEDVQRQLSAAQEDSGQLLQAKTRALQEALQQNAVLLTQKGALTTRVAELERDCDALRRDLSMERSSLGEQRTAKEEMRARNAELTAELRTCHDSLEEVRGDLAEATRRVEHLTADCTNAENGRALAETQRVSLAGEVEELRAALDKLREDYGALHERAGTASGAAAEKAEEIAQLRARLQEDQSELQQLEAALASAVAAHAEELAHIREEHSAAVAEASRAADESTSGLQAAHARQMEELRAELSRQLDELRSAHEAEVHAQWEAHLRETEALMGDGSAQADALRGELSSAEARASELEAAAGGLRDRCEQLETELRASEDAREAQSTASATQATADAKRIEQLSAEVAELQSRGLEELQARQGVLAELQARTATELDALRKRSAEELLAKDAAHDASEAKLRAAHASALEELRAEQAQRLRELHDLHAQNLSGANQDSAAQVAALQDTMARRLVEAAAAADAMERDLRSQICSLEGQLDRAGAEADARGEESAERTRDMLQQLRDAEAELHARESEWRASRAHDEKESERHLAEAEARLRAAHSGEVARLEAAAEAAAAAHAKSLAEALEAAEETLGREKARHVESLSALKEALSKEKNDVVSSVHDVYAGKLKGLQERCDEALALLNTKVAKANDEARSTHLQLDAVSADLGRARAEMEALQRSMEAERRRAAEEMERTRAMHEATRASLIQENEAAFRQASHAHKSVVDDLNRQNAEAAASYEALIADLRAALQELDHKYTYRESRPEDVDLINQLIADNQAKKQALHKAYEDMKTYKLELINREENYNKLFGRKPVVQATKAPASAEARSLPVIKSNVKSNAASRASLN